MDINNIIESLYRHSASAKDLIVINGGEPTIHPDFYELIEKMNNNFASEIVVYSNGSLLVANQLPHTSKISFVIPIHGSKNTHDSITQKDNSYSNTIHNIQALDTWGYKYRLKFIINSAMIAEKFIINDFITQNNFNPEELILARLNRTKKSDKNGVSIPPYNQLSSYIKLQMQYLNRNARIKFLDIPPCFFENELQTKESCDAPAFFFNDPHNNMQNRKYYKDIMIGSNCDGCADYNICKLMEKSYLTLSVSKNNLVLECE